MIFYIIFLFVRYRATDDINENIESYYREYWIVSDYSDMKIEIYNILIDELQQKLDKIITNYYHTMNFLNFLTRAGFNLRFFESFLKYIIDYLNYEYLQKNKVDKFVENVITFISKIKNSNNAYENLSSDTNDDSDECDNFTSHMIKNVQIPIDSRDIGYNAQLIIYILGNIYKKHCKLAEKDKIDLLKNKMIRIMVSILFFGRYESDFKNILIFYKKYKCMIMQKNKKLHKIINKIISNNDKKYEILPLKHNYKELDEWSLLNHDINIIRLGNIDQCINIEIYIEPYIFFVGCIKKYQELDLEDLKIELDNKLERILLLYTEIFELTQQYNQEHRKIVSFNYKKPIQNELEETIFKLLLKKYYNELQINDVWAFFKLQRDQWNYHFETQYKNENK